MRRNSRIPVLTAVLSLVAVLAFAEFSAERSSKDRNEDSRLQRESELGALARGSARDTGSANRTASNDLGVGNALIAKTGFGSDLDGSRSRLAAPGSEQEGGSAGQRIARPERISGFDPVAAGSTAARMLRQAADPFDIGFLSSATELASGTRNPARSLRARSVVADQELPTAYVQERYCEELLPATDGNLLSVKLAGGVAPKGLLLNPISGMFCGAPTESGIFRFAAEFQFSLDYVFRKTFRLVVAERTGSASDQPLEIVTEQLEPGQVGAEYVFQLQAAGGSSPYAWEIEGVPLDLEYDRATGVLAGTPIEAGEYLLTVTVRSSDGTTAVRALSLLVRQTPMFITTSELAEGVFEQPYQDRLAAQGGELPYKWELLEGELPAGVQLDSATGVLSGIAAEAGEFAPTFRIIDADGVTDSVRLALTVRASSLEIATTGLVEGFVADPYRTFLIAAGGVPPYRWTVAAGALPTGLFIREIGEIRGVPSGAGEFSFEVVLQDQIGQIATRRFGLRIQELLLPEPDEDSDLDPVPTDTPPVTPPSNPGGPATPPPVLPSVSGFQAVASEQKVGLSWRNPAHPAWIQTLIVRGEGIAPTGASEGLLVYAGTDTTELDTEVELGSSYVYVAFAEYAPATPGVAPGTASSLVTPTTLSLYSKPDPFADRVAAFQPLDQNCFGCSRVSEAVLGPPMGGGDFVGGTDVVSLGAADATTTPENRPAGGTITLEFTDNLVVDGPGVDFTIFENPFRFPGTDLYFIEPAIVEVSADGIRYYRFPFDFVPHYNSDGSLNLFNPFSYARGFAGIKPVYSNANIPSSPLPTNRALSGGDQFDLSDLPGQPLRWIRFVRITSTGDSWLRDRDGELVRHSNSFPTFAASSRGNSGFDLDAVVAVNY